MATWYQILSIFCIWADLVSGEELFCPLDHDHQDCSQRGVHCTIIRDPECRLSTTPGRAVADYPGPVTNLTVRPYYLTPEHPVPPNSISRVEISWNLPPNGTHRHLAGFEVRLAQGRAMPYCFVFNLSISGDVTWDRNKLYEYTLNCSKLNNSPYSVTVTSLPRAPFSDKVSSALLKIVQKKRDTDPVKCASSLAEQRRCWDTDMVVYNQQCTRSVRVTFTQAPQALDIERYDIAIIEHNRYTSDKTEIVSRDDNKRFLEITINLSGVKLPLPNRTIVIIPRGELCNLNRCRDSISGVFDIREKNSSSKECSFRPPRSPKPSPGPYEETFLIAIIAGSVLAAGILTVVIALVARHKLRAGRRRSSPYVYDNTPSDSRSLLSASSNNSHKHLLPPCNRKNGTSPVPYAILQNRKRVFLVYSNDSPLHQNVIGCFHTFLKSFNFDVIYDRMHTSDQQILENKSAWIRQTMDACDFILVINSEGTFCKGQVFQNNFHYPKFDTESSCIGDIFIPSLHILTEDVSRECPVLEPKIILAHFAYTPSEKMCTPLNYLKEKANYKLMVHIDDMIKHMNPSVSSSMISDGSLLVQLSNALVQAIGHKETMVRTKPDWFQCYNGPPVPCVVTHNLLRPGTAALLAQSRFSDVPDSMMGTTSCPDICEPSTLGTSTRVTVPSATGYMLPQVARPRLPEDMDSEIGCQITDINNEDSGLGKSKNFSGSYA